MVDRRRAIVAVLALAAAAAGLWWMLLGPSPEGQIRAQLETLCRLVSKQADEKGVQAALKGRALPPLFAHPVEIRGDAGPVAGVHTPTGLASLIASGRAGLHTIDLTTTDLTVEIRSPGEADISFTGRLRVNASPAGGGADVTYRQIAAHLRNVDGAWVFSTFNVVNVMKGQ
jgi:hypothetical protein